MSYEPDDDGRDAQQEWAHHAEMLRQQEIEAAFRAFERAREDYWREQLQAEIEAQQSRIQPLDKSH